VTTATLHVLALNSGSSSLKFGLYRVDAAGAACLLAGAEPNAAAKEPNAANAPDAAGSAVLRIARQLAACGLPPPQAVGHRVVHGGPRLRQHARITPELLRTLKAAAAFAPLHTPATLALIASATQHFPGLPQVACFDTTFHAGLPDVARVLPLPRALQAEGVQRYGFHGLSCESIVRQLGAALPRRLLIAHLGNGASITAVQDGRSIDTSMGLTPSGGLVMGTRSGNLDPGVLVYLLRAQGLDADGLEDLIDRHSGLAGISGGDSDMRSLHAAAPRDADADLAVRIFCYAAAQQAAAMAVALGGVDGLVFTGGIGENDAAVRSAIGDRLRFIGVTPDRVQVLPSEEDAQIALHVGALC
jgi:acetate kinase